MSPLAVVLLAGILQTIKGADPECSPTVMSPSVDFDRSPESQVLTAGEGLELSCQVMSVPQATIRWMRNGQAIGETDAVGLGWEQIENNEMTTVGLAVTKSRLILPCADRRVAGKYSCVAETQCQRKVKNATVEIEGSGRCLRAQYGESPKIWMWTPDRMERFDAAVQLVCRADGVPKPQITWYEENELDQFKLIESSANRTILPSGDLLVKETVKEGAMYFKCVAKNAHGEDERQLLIIQVIL